MDKEQIFKLVKEHFNKQWYGHGWTEFSGKIDAFVRFAEVIYEKGYDQGYFEATGDND